VQGRVANSWFIAADFKKLTAGKYRQTFWLLVQVIKVGLSAKNLEKLGFPSAYRVAKFSSFLFVVVNLFFSKLQVQLRKREKRTI
jgi:hypothetical protein